MSELITSEFLKYRKVIASLLGKIRPSASAQDIEDILQDTFINTYQASLKQEIQFPKAFMVKTAVRLANRTLKLASRDDAREDIEEFADSLQANYQALGFVSETEQVILSRQDFTILCQAVELLPEQCRKVFILKKIYGLSQREIADRLKISQSTVEKHVAKGLLKTSQYYLSAKSRDESRNKVVPFQDKKSKNRNGGKQI